MLPFGMFEWSDGSVRRATEAVERFAVAWSCVKSVTWLGMSGRLWLPAVPSLHPDWMQADVIVPFDTRRCDHE